MQGWPIQPLILMTSTRNANWVDEFNRTWTAGTKLAHSCGYIGDVEMRGGRNYLPGLCCESNHKEAEDQTQVMYQSVG